MGVLVVSGLNISEDGDAEYQYLTDVTDQLRKTYAKRRFEPAFYEPSIIEWTKAFERLGIDPNIHKPSHIALYDMITGGKDLPNINSLVNLTNAISLKYLTPVGTHDLDKVTGDITIGKVYKEMHFGKLTKEYDPVQPGYEFAYMDEEKILTRHFVWRQCWESRINTESKNIIIPIDTLDLESDEILEIGKELVSLIKHFINAEEYHFGILDNEKPELTSTDLEKILDSHALHVVTHEIKKDEEIITRILNRSVEEVLPSKDSLRDLLMSGRRLKVYQGFDPTADTLHIGHTVMMRKLEDFRKLGHEVTMLIGDFTARIGDPTDKSSQRSRLTEEEVNENLQNYKEQASKILDFEDTFNPVNVKFNNSWLGALSFTDLIDISAEFTVQQMVKRDMFKKRIEEDRPIYLNEFLYPLMQGWDSVAMEIDVELGGNDQLFNMLAGRQLVSRFLGKEKIVVAGKLLTSAGGKKMGKSEGNMIKLSDSPNDMYGKVMSMDDSIVLEAFELLTEISQKAIEDIEQRLNSGINPMELKKELAYTITADHCGEDQAREAQRYFEQVFQQKTFETDLEVVNIRESEISLIDLIVENFGGEISKGQVRRMIEQGAVSIDGEKIDRWDHIFIPTDGMIIKFGKKIRKISIER